MLLGGIEVLEAGDSVRAANSAALGQALATAGDTPSVQRVMAQMIRTAYPERYDD